MVISDSKKKVTKKKRYRIDVHFKSGTIKYFKKKIIMENAKAERKIKVEGKGKKEKNVMTSFGSLEAIFSYYKRRETKSFNGRRYNIK